MPKYIGIGAANSMKKKRKRKYWYDITIRECVLCGDGETLRERKYGRKPAWQKRRHFEQYACADHFL